MLFTGKVVFTWFLCIEFAMDDEKLVEAVCSFSCLWQVSSKSYKDPRAKENARKEVASMVSVHES